MLWYHGEHDEDAGRLFEEYCLRFLSQVGAVRAPKQFIHVDGRLVSKTPDIQVCDPYGGRATVECKWGTAQLSVEQHRYYQSLTVFEPVFILRGDGTDPSNPDSLYLMPIDDMKGPYVNIDAVASYRIRKSEVIRSVEQMVELAHPHLTSFPKR